MQFFLRIRLFHISILFIIFLNIHLQNELYAVLGGDEESSSSVPSMLRCIHAARDLLHSRQDVLPAVTRILAKLLCELLCAVVLHQVRVLLLDIVAFQKNIPILFEERFMLDDART